MNKEKKYLCPKCNEELFETGSYPIQGTKEFHCFSCNTTLELHEN